MLVLRRKSLATVTVMAAPLHWTEIAPCIEALVAVLRVVELVAGAAVVIVG